MKTPQLARVVERFGLDPLPLTGGELDAWIERTTEELRALATSLHFAGAIAAPTPDQNGGACPAGTCGCFGP